ncbi:16621_t:CDS:2 [Funneliformis geosporum]|nr:16621_t:CDS:2 [Funneliformis geosporum]
MENQSLPSSFSNKEFNIVVNFGMVMIILNGFCTLYVLCRTLTRWIISKKSLPMALRVPFYIALSDFMIFSINFPNMLFPIIYGVPWSDSNCKIIGGITFFTISTNITLVGLLAFLTYLRICRKMYIDLGKYDYKAILFILFSGFVYTSIGLPSYGNDNSNSNLNRNFALNRNNVEGNNDGNDKNNDNVSNNVKKIEPIVVRKIIGYVLIFIFQWTPPMTYVFGQIIDYDPLWVYLVTDASVNMGGIGNMIQFIINEGWKDPYVPPTKRTSTGSSFINTSPEPTTSTQLHELTQINNTNVEFIIKVDTNTEVSETFEVLTCDNSNSSVTKDNTDNEHFTKNEETHIS